MSGNTLKKIQYRAPHAFPSLNFLIRKKIIGTPFRVRDHVNNSGTCLAYNVAPNRHLTKCLKSTETEQQTHTETPYLNISRTGELTTSMFYCMASMINNIILLCPPLSPCTLHSLARALSSKLCNKVTSPLRNHPKILALYQLPPERGLVEPLLP